MPTFKGIKEATLVKRDYSFIHGQGWTVTEEYHGGHNEIAGLFNGLAADGWSFAPPSKVGPVSILVASKQAPPDGNSDEYYDRFSINSEKVQYSIWDKKSVQDEGSTFFDSYRGFIEDAVEDGDESGLEATLPIALYPEAWKVYTELVRGAESIEHEYITLRRERLVSLNYGSPIAITAGGAGKIYTTTGMEAAFGFPALTGITYPVDPGNAPTGTVYGWRVRTQEINYVQNLRAEINQDWVWAAWSTFIYGLA